MSERLTDWEPIEAAALDGSIILVRRGQWAPFHAFWRDGRWNAIEYSAEGVVPTHYSRAALHGHE